MSMIEARVTEQAYRQAVRAPIDEVASFLQDILGRRLVAYIGGVQDTKTVARWANAEVVEVRSRSLKRLKTAYEIAQLLTQFDSPQSSARRHITGRSDP